ncbi:hypothetical protein L6164_024946 [Bauhinia variegata]|uniref:Uncharacterized protein n=1 Tax=Bauhinia variegata TaxID=167791 RepID=A0ACB9M023_BAUVA|nr:hypothetical protein L6164_024946 [Bauhinia variegata]
MGDGAMSPGALLEAPPESSMDFNYMDELFLDGCWLETTAEGSDFLLQSPSNCNPLFDPSFSWPIMETNGGLSVSPSLNGNQEERQSPLFNESRETPSNAKPVGKDIINIGGSCSQSEFHSVEGSEVVRRWWIQPTPTSNLGPASSVTERLIRALVYIKEMSRDKDVLVQIWVPVNGGDREILTTNDLPFSLGSTSQNLAKYREISEKYHFSAEDDSKELAAGLPGRVFRGKVPEWTPDVRFFRSDEYPRVDHAQEYDVRGTLALPVFEKGSRNCLGVIEVVMTTQQIKYRSQLESVCKALEAVDLRSSGISSIQNVKEACNKSYEAVLPEIQEVLRSACEIYKLPLAQTWVPCIRQSKEGCRHSNDNYLRCVSPVDHACYVGDPSVQAFHEACSEHHLLKGQGVVGGAFMSNQPCFSADITSMGKTEYPLSHHARMFRLRAAVAIRLRSIHCSGDDFVLEFFLPLDCVDGEEHKKMLTSLSMIIQRVCHSLRVITNKELEEETRLSVDEVIVPAESVSARTATWTDLQRSGTVASLCAAQKSSETFARKFSDLSQQQQQQQQHSHSAFDEGSLSSWGTGKTGEKRRTKAEKTITLQVLRQNFAGSLKDAAKNIGVCTTTLKRICRQHGIKRWPSRKIKKVGHSLQKLQLVIDSVQGGSGAFQIDSFYSNFAELATPNLTGTSLLSAAKQNDSHNANPSATEAEPGMLSPSKSPSSSGSGSGSQSSFSSHSFSSISEQRHLTLKQNVASSKDQDCSGGGVLKRVRSEAKLKGSSLDGAMHLPRSQSQEALGQHPKVEFLQPRTHQVAQNQKEDPFRVKVTYGDEKSRFRMPKNCAYEDLLGEISKRFNIDDMSKFDIKYLDDDSEWVLLTCAADLEECIDVCQSRTIKLSLHVSNHRMGRQVH